ncbi:FKBP-type peptidyl-prolyl cis-trans isomerase [Sulfurimonas sp.]|uniref:FKBP-type peptidyl-prolyl cis-trans isomerase n=1 Tax=Sulfurimonas sp. TaxID=2022749 RepID=UPI0025DB520D|nr:FKBP-type peptidyl-prolyl cis-trans isomerase [Sulfurimonas sp.]MBW6488345.1 peptidylprolyl isomerase [Sulfurimonas sp.]
MDKIKKNTLVSMLIKLEDEEGNIIDESEELMYIHGGYNQIFQKLEDELEGKKIGDTFHVTLTPAEAFGEYDETLVLKELLKDLPDDIHVGAELDGEEEGVVYVVESIEKKHATLNANHELAGIPLVASGKILEIEQLSDEAAKELLKAEHHH